MTRREQCEYVYRGFQHDGRQITHSVTSAAKEPAIGRIYALHVGDAALW